MKKRTLISLICLSVALLSASGCATAGAGSQGSAQSGTRLYDEADLNHAEKDLPNLNDESVLEDYLRYAALNNPGLKAAFNSWRASMERITQARSLPDPQLSYGYFIEEVETRVGPQQHKVELSQMFPWFGKLRLKEDMAAHAAEAAYSTYQVQKLKLFYTVKNVYYEYYYLARSIAITKQNMKLVEDLEEVARRKYAAGSADHAVVIKAQVELGRLEDRLKTLNDLKKPIMVKLNASLNRKRNMELPWPRTAEIEEPEIDEGDLLIWLRESNPDLKALESKVAQQEDAVALAGKNYFPDIMLGAGWIGTGEALNPELEGSGDDPVIGMIGINLPIWFGTYRAAEREAAARLESANQKLEDRENTLGADISMAFFRYKDAIRKIDLYGKSLLPKARQSLEVSQQAFESGKLDFLTLIDAERVLLEFELAYERALSDRAQRLAELEMLIGRSISLEGETSVNEEAGK